MDRMRRGSLTSDERADGRITSFLTISAILTVVLIVSFVFQPPLNIGPQEGNLAPNILGGKWQNNAWDDGWNLYDDLDRDWQAGDAGGRLILLQFLDTDCPHCWSEGEMMSNLHTEYGSYVSFYSVVVELGIPGHDGSREELQAFQSKSNLEGCNSEQSNCADRSGGVHSWPYIDDLDRSSLDDWEVPGTPFSVLLYGNGTVAWNPLQHQYDGEEIESALPRLLQEVSS